MKELTADIARKLLKYNKDNGKLFWKYRDLEFFNGKTQKAKAGFQKAWNAKFAGKEAFVQIHPRNGQKSGSIFGISYIAHRVIWLIEYGYWPLEIDHIDGNSSNNLLVNLREVDTATNQRNKSKRKDNKTGYNGICFEKFTGKFRATITDRQGKIICLGRYSSAEEAARVRNQNNSKHQYHANHGREKNV